MMEKLQKLGRALMVPVAVLPAAAILMGIGYWIDPVGWGANSPVAALLIKAGSSIIDNMPILFAVGVAYGMSKDKDGAAALAGLVGFLVVTTLLSPAAIAQFTKVDVAAVAPAFGKINNQFVGIVVGVMSASLYDKFYKVELPKALTFFSGRRLVPILTSVAAMLLSLVLYFIWPVLYSGLVTFGKSIVSMGPFGAGIYGFFNRLLIPVGLHHALNGVFWFDVAGINDIGNFWASKGTKGITGMYQAGFFPIMMFGLLGGALAFVHTARPAQKAKVASIMGAAAFASFFTGVTEPIEFAFMFVAPVLYLLHAVLTGISLFIAASMHWIAGFGFSAGFVDLVLSSRMPMAVNWFMLILQGAVFFAVYYFSFKFVINKMNLMTPGRNPEEDVEEDLELDRTSTGSAHSQTAAVLLEALGGKENIVSVDNCATRLRLEVKDTDKINTALVKRYSSGILTPSKTTAQIVVGTQVQFVADELKKLV
ncbi:MAG: PTS transporter subunit EIIC [Leptotrichiaceae bacterium]|nr:PTS transporter subunit EIIC [Leptotrichiaceae bacterium]